MQTKKRMLLSGKAHTFMAALTRMTRRHQALLATYHAALATVEGEYEMEEGGREEESMRPAMRLRQIADGRGGSASSRVSAGEEEDTGVEITEELCAI